MTALVPDDSGVLVPLGVARRLAQEAAVLLYWRVSGLPSEHFETEQARQYFTGSPLATPLYHFIHNRSRELAQQADTPEVRQWRWW